MPVIDDRGRLFGRLNLIDALVAIVVLGLIPLAYGVFLMFRPPVPIVRKISPQQFTEYDLKIDRPRLLITGENFREALLPVFGQFPSPAFLVQDSQHAEVVVPLLPVGSYDLKFLDGQRLLLTLPNAINVVPTPPRPVVVTPPIPSGVATITVRFISEPEVAKVMKVGDVDVAGPAAETDRAVLTSIGTDREMTSALIVVESVLGRNSFQIQRPVVVFTATLRVPVVLARLGWTFRDRPIKVGAPFTFVSLTGAFGGSILDVKVLTQK